MSAEFETIENDPAAVVEAIHKLVEVAVIEDSALIDWLKSWPDPVRYSTLTDPVLHPVASSCRCAIDVLIAHLGTLIGKAAARVQVSVIIAEQTSTPEVRDTIRNVERTSGKPTPSSPRSVH